MQEKTPISVWTEALRGYNRPTDLPEVTEDLVKYRDKQNYNATYLHLLFQSSWAKNDVELIQDFIKKGANVNAKDNSDMTPLHYAAAHKARKEVIELLLTRGRS